MCFSHVIFATSVLSPFTQPSIMAWVYIIPKAHEICATLGKAIQDIHECTPASSLHHVRSSRCRCLHTYRERMSHCGLETDNRDLGAGFGGLRSRVQCFLRLEICFLQISSRARCGDGKDFGHFDPSTDFVAVLALYLTKEPNFSIVFIRLNPAYPTHDDHEAENVTELGYSVLSMRVRCRLLIRVLL
jgi:hypothetical protein